MAGGKMIYHAQCSRTGQHFLIETQRDKLSESVVNFVDITDEQARQLGNGSEWPALDAAFSLRSCRWCGSRRVGGCRCQRDRELCPEKGSYRYACLFCDMLRPARVPAGDVRSLRLSVTSPRFDDIGTLLNAMGLETAPFSQTGFDCDVLFINCGTRDAIQPEKLREFVCGGGCVYVSDLAYSHLIAAFPDALSVKCSGKACSCRAHIRDPELQSIIGPDITVCYDLSRWAVIQQHRGEALILGADPALTNPMMISFPEGQGRVFFTSFHNHKQASKEELAVLKLMLLRQIGEVCNQSIREVGRSLGLNISDLDLPGRG